MDKFYIRKNIIILFVVCAIFTFIAGICFGGVASAEEAPVEVESVTAIVGCSIVDGVVIPEYGDYSATEGNHTNYASGITLNFKFSEEVDFYRIDLSINGYDTVGQKSRVPEGGRLSYKLREYQNGIVTVTAVAYVGDEEAKVSRTVYSDNEGPEVPDASGMDKFCGVGEVYNVFINTDLPDVNEVYYYVDGSLTKVQTDGISLSLSKNTVLTVYFFDYAYNCITREYNFDKFDTVKPPKPEITVTPNADLSYTGGYASSYRVSINYGVDNLSGIERRLYSVNGKAYEDYLSEFYLTGETTYTIAAYSVDGAGNVSVTEQYALTSKIDATDPVISSIYVSYDIRTDKVATVRVHANDARSGIESVKLGDLFFRTVLDGVYELQYDCYGKSSATVTVTDKAGNYTSSNVIFDYFRNSDVSDKVKNYANWYKTADLDMYTESAKADLEKAFDKLGVLLASSATTRENFNLCFGETDRIIAGTNKILYSVISAPTYLSGALGYTITESDFVDYLKGEEIKLTFESNGTKDLFGKASGFSKSFSENFSLKIIYKGGDAGNLENGIKISLNMPVGFYERSYALYDVDTGEKIDIVCINNKIEFTLKKSSSLSLVISGAPEPVSNAKQKGVTVFGRSVSYGAFFGVLGGGIGFVAIGVVVIVILFKRRGK